MNEIMLSVRPKWCELIAKGQKTIEIRKTKPNCDVPFKVYIYCTKPSKKYQTVWGCFVFNSDELFRLPTGKIKYGDSVEMMMYDNYTTDNFLNGKVIGEFVCDNVEVLFDTKGNPENYITEILPSILQKTALSYDEFAAYVGSRADKNSIYGWHISDLKIYDEPKQLSEFEVKQPPQSWCYVERRD